MRVISAGTTGKEKFLRKIESTVNSTCSQANIPESSPECEIHLKVNSLYYASAVSQAKRLSTNSSVVVCPYPCSHAMVWDTNYAFVVQNIISLGL